MAAGALLVPDECGHDDVDEAPDAEGLRRGEGTMIDLASLEHVAAARLPQSVYDYVAGGAEDESTLRANVSAWEDLELWPHVLRDVSTVTTATTVLGKPVDTPVLVSPTAMHRLVCDEGELATAGAAADAGTVYIVSMTATTSMEDIAAQVPGGRRWFQLYMQQDRGLTRELCGRARDAGFEALCVTVDSPVISRRPRLEGGVFAVPPDLPLPNLDTVAPGRPDRQLGSLVAGFDAAVTFDDLELFRQWSGLPLVVKGVVRGDDARHCFEAGASAVSVSNHGGRQLDTCVATARALPWVAEAAEGLGEVYVDGGIRRGTDVVKALALGARAVLIGRSVVWGLAVDGERGARSVIAELTDQTARTLAFCGATSPGEVDRQLLGPEAAATTTAGTAPLR
jgi:4-hydroxymandelate oxidase